MAKASTTKAKTTKAAVAKNDGEPLDQRTTIMFSVSDITDIDDWRAEKRIWSRGEAIRQLVKLGLGQDTKSA